MKELLDFIVIGAQKSGTTTLFEYLAMHPQIALPPGKEAPFFSHDNSLTRGWAEYLRRAFPFADPIQKWGTVTPHYMTGTVYDAAHDHRAHYDERTIPSRIQERIPHVRLVAILRDPVERALSHHAMMVMNAAESRSFDDAITELLTPEKIMLARSAPTETNAYVAWGEYGRILGGYLDVFPRKQLLVLFTRDLAHDPKSLLHRLYDFIGVDTEPAHRAPFIKSRVGSVSRRVPWLDLNRAQEAVATNSVTRTLWRTMPYSTRRYIDQVFIRARYRVELWNRRNRSYRSLPVSDETLTRLRAHFCEDCESLSRRFSISLPW